MGTVSATWPACGRDCSTWAELGVDAHLVHSLVCIAAADGGYDVADYRAIDPSFGSLAEAERLILEARQLGIRTIVDIVPNHVSDSIPGSRRRSPQGRGRRNGAVLVPSRSGQRRQRDAQRWVSNFSGPAWTRTQNPDGTPGEWYLHLFSARQPD